MSNKYKLGSLFDGSGGFPLAGSMCGIEPVWASEVEPYPIAVTRCRFPAMKHLGDISKINGAEIEPVDIITFGSPCQDLSVAGKRAGLKHESNGDEETTRSGLFMEAVRIIKEMLEATNGVYPRFALWENVPGAFSSNGGEDFRIVLEELIKIVEPAAVMPAVPAKGWAYADSYSGDGWSLAYRVFDAQYWGVPQRRRRIHLVFDFRGQCARNILFEREGVRGYFTKGRTPWKGTSHNAENGVGADDREGDSNCLTPWDVQSRRIFTADGPWPALYGGEGGGHGYVAIPCMGQGNSADGQASLEPIVCIKMQYLYENHSQDTRYKGPLDVCPMLPAQLGTGGNNTPFVVECQPTVYNGENITSPLNKVNPQPGDPCHTLGTDSRNYVVFCIDGDKIGKAERSGGSGLGIRPGDKMYTLTAKDAGAHAVCISYIVRRLTPTECARLQGFADRWGDIDPKEDFTDEEYAFWMEVRNTHAAINGKAVKEYTKPQMVKWYNKLRTDSSEYKMWGNGIALPPALYCMQGIVDALERKGNANG